MLLAIRRGYGIPLKRLRDAMEYLRRDGGDMLFLAHRDFRHDRQHLYLSRDDYLVSLSERGQHVEPGIIQEGLRQIVYGDDGYTNMHDWGWLYLAPYGWLPMDVTTGRFESPDPQLAGFYFGGLDAYRVAYNDDYGRDFVPAKRFDRSETVDSQRGEVMGLFSSVGTLFRTAGMVASGALYNQVHPHAPYWLAAATTLLILAVAPRIRLDDVARAERVERLA